ncbi:MAG: PAS domain-containing protein [Bdellovibrio sp.]
MESQFGIEELFFSKTDFRGIIQSGNSVFVRVSEYSEEELLLKPHNVIRHPDMPRAIFQLLWSFLKEGKPIVAYVKNKSKSNRYYWVLAMAFPMEDGYLSIRLKPSSPILNEIKTVYAKMLELEKENNRSMEESTKFLLDYLAQRGFESYDSFMKVALVTELKARDAVLANVPEKNKHKSVESSELKINEQFRELLAASNDCTKAIRAGFECTTNLNTNLENFKNHNLEINNTCQRVKFTTTNLTVSSAKAGELGKPLSVVSANLNKLSGDISASAENLEKTLNMLEQVIQEIIFTFAVSRFQIEMTNHLMQENTYGNNSQNFNSNINLLCQLVCKGFEKLEKSTVFFSKAIRSLLQASKELKKTTAGMDVINVVGRIEVIKIPDETATLDSILEEIQKLTDAFKLTLRNLEAECTLGIGSSNKINENTQNISRILNIMTMVHNNSDSMTNASGI